MPFQLLLLLLELTEETATPKLSECVVAPPQRSQPKTKAIALPGKLCDRLLINIRFSL
ncbi:hypothetical protein [Anabaena sp. CCY 9910]|uniref:hypothetical protein n=1 Tax=Anabaena sp. CCY 9910 TaxID=3103870 RepID=UPI0039E1E880